MARDLSLLSMTGAYRMVGREGVYCWLYQFVSSSFFFLDYLAGVSSFCHTIPHASIPHVAILCIDAFLYHAFDLMGCILSLLGWCGLGISIDCIFVRTCQSQV
ncbi:hypothetical protein BP00DRAFT_241516 [Aspergillus indologenus CBS 114.80]|uniref:Uncharacterized protein n=1 Tax=Aspergillus indologenus CBS 114.80 TaxID=1450541 RepID=A0A2V5I4R5_9EURO|nr:hypothetical protein BP00DRAFT_241516 [Aspergillus indologenus CBS 114.80]